MSAKRVEKNRKLPNNPFIPRSSLLHLEPFFGRNVSLSGEVGFVKTKWNSGQTDEGIPLTDRKFASVLCVDENHILANGFRMCVMVDRKYAVEERIQNVFQPIPSGYGECLIYTSMAVNEDGRDFWTILIHGSNYVLEVVITLF